MRPPPASHCRSLSISSSVRRSPIPKEAQTRSKQLLRFSTVNFLRILVTRGLRLLKAHESHTYRKPNLSSHDITNLPASSLNVPFTSDKHICMLLWTSSTHRESSTDILHTVTHCVRLAPDVRRGGFVALLWSVPVAQGDLMFAGQRLVGLSIPST